MAIVAELRGIALGYVRNGVETRILDHVDIVLDEGEFVAIVGPSGAGKSTLLRVVMGLVEPSAGEVRLRPAGGRGRRGAALVFQDAKLLPWRKVLANAAFGLEGLGLPRAQVKARALAALELVGLGDKADRWPHQLSGGQRQRVGVARALAVDPDLLLMDEPFGALDAITRAQLQDELLTLWQRTRKTVLFVTHDIDEAVYLADRVLVLGGTPAAVRGSFTIDRKVRSRADPGAARLHAEILACLENRPAAAEYQI